MSKKLVTPAYPYRLQDNQDRAQVGAIDKNADPLLDSIKVGERSERALWKTQASMECDELAADGCNLTDPYPTDKI